jgi:murein L,D-transpeptidase YcbB/YkuD
MLRQVLTACLAFRLLAGAVPTTDVPLAIASLLETWRAAPDSPGDPRQLASLYGVRGHAALWVDDTGRPTGDAQAAIALLTDAPLEGLDPLDYDTVALRASAVRLRAGDASARDIARFDVGLSVDTLRYLRHLHAGRVEPSVMGYRLPPRAPEDLVERLRAGIAAHRIPAAAAELAPSMALYRQLRGALAGYRRVAADPALQSFTPPRATVHPGDRCEELPALSRYLAAVGDLTSGAPRADALVYDATLVDAVRRFQGRHGLEQDGVLGKSTRAALGVPLSWRVRQIELSLERLRWLPDLGPERFLAVNIPMFRVWGLEGEPAARMPSFSTEVIVGRALNTRTPVLLETMEYVIFRPYWNVPQSILRNEILPALRRDPDYLHRHDMEMVSARGEVRVRQRPGPGNSLGLVKFVFPNDNNVYLHGTPAPALFSRARRDFSHGCIRVADPVGLAAWVLAGEPGWSRDRILAAMHASATTRVDLAHSIRVVLFYLTAVVMPDDGAVHFAEDIYGHDARLHQALEQSCESKMS